MIKTLASQHLHKVIAYPSFFNNIFLSAGISEHQAVSVLEGVVVSRQGTSPVERRAPDFREL